MPDDGALPTWVGQSPPSEQGFGVYIHVPFCTVRCGYCDFNTYTATELGGGASQAAYADTALREIELAAGVLERAGLPARPLSTVFVGGGTPTVLPPGDLARLLDGARSAWGLAPGAEVTTEANPDSVTPASLAQLAAAGFTRVSFGMQSAQPHVLATLERTHDPRRIPDVVRWAKAAGLAVSLDLIYGTPGESIADWPASLEAVLATGVDHVSAYALGVEQGTKMAPGRAPRRRPAGTTWRTGAATTGGASARARTRISAAGASTGCGLVACGGGTSSTRGPTRSGSRPGSARRQAARRSTPPRPSSSA